MERQPTTFVRLESCDGLRQCLCSGYALGGGIRVVVVDPRGDCSSMKWMELWLEGLTFLNLLCYRCWGFAPVHVGDSDAKGDNFWHSTCCSHQVLTPQPVPGAAGRARPAHLSLTPAFSGRSYHCYHSAERAEWHTLSQVVRGHHLPWYRTLCPDWPSPPYGFSISFFILIAG